MDTTVMLRRSAVITVRAQYQRGEVSLDALYAAADHYIEAMREHARTCSPSIRRRFRYAEPGVHSAGAMTALPSLQARATLPACLLDLATVYPGPLAASHDLLAVDGRRYTFTGDVTGGLWTRSLEPGCTDVHVWTPEGGYYLGWVVPGELHWATPPERVMPRWWDPAIPWEATFPHYVQAHRTAAGGNTFSDTVLTITIRSVVEQGEPLIYIGGGEGELHEHWWLSRTLPIRGGGCAPGIRGFLLLAAGQVTGSAEFTEWVPASRDGRNISPWPEVR